MTYCREHTELLAAAGEETATALLPEAFRLYYSCHSTGIQMRIVTAASPIQTVWQGSVWHSHIYEFNDRGDVPGLQPDFAFAADTINAYFDAVKSAVEHERAKHAAWKAEREAAALTERQAAIEATRAAIAHSSTTPADTTRSTSA